MRIEMRPVSRSTRTNFCLLSPVKDKAQHAVVFEKSTLEKLNKDVQTYRLITVATLVDRLKINGSLARKALADLEEQGQIKKVVSHSKLNIYSAFLP
jgi:small subunit ribosomal protein S25e